MKLHEKDNKEQLTVTWYVTGTKLLGHRWDPWGGGGGAGGGGGGGGLAYHKIVGPPSNAF